VFHSVIRVALVLQQRKAKTTQLMKAPANVNRWRRRQKSAARARRGTSPLAVFARVMIIAAVLLSLATLFSTFTRPSSPPQGAQLELKVGLLRVAPSVESKTPPADLDALTARLRTALEPFQTKHLVEVGAKVAPCTSDESTFRQATPGFLPGCPSGGCASFESLEEAQGVCSGISSCGGVTKSRGMFELRHDSVPFESSSEEVSWPRVRCRQEATAALVWEAFREAMEGALDEEETYHLGTTYETREDGSIFLAISSYRDITCSDTLRGAFAAAKFPEKLFVGIIQQNCDGDVCHTGTGWAESRRWVMQDHPDPDCAEEFCQEFPELCKDHVRILRLKERESYGPFFGRFLNSKMYRGENFYMQIDAHTEFRQDWDHWIVEEMRRTPSYPHSVISNYPPSGDPRKTGRWEAPSGYTRETLPSALCGCTFEDAGGAHKTVRLSQTSRTFAHGVDSSIPHHACFVAAGFLIAHGSIVANVPFDPFMPFLFMGEEISLSIRLWTSGYDIYAPSIDVVRHEYVRKESPKFWESVGMVFSNPSIHNALTDIIIPRVQALVGWKDKPAYMRSVYTRQEDYGCGEKRSSSQFVQTMQIQVGTLQQSAPTWCLKGKDMPKELSSWKV